jgi:hypothetical protein
MAVILGVWVLIHPRRPSASRRRLGRGVLAHLQSCSVVPAGVDAPVAILSSEEVSL